jgi:hypothetical protein
VLVTEKGKSKKSHHVAAVMSGISIAVQTTPFIAGGGVVGVGGVISCGVQSQTKGNNDFQLYSLAQSHVSAYV